MKRFAYVTLGLASLALAGCGHSDSANTPASTDNVEMPAEEAMSGVTAAPSDDASANATDAESNAAPDDAADTPPSSGRSKPSGGAKPSGSAKPSDAAAATTPSAAPSSGN